MGILRKAGHAVARAPPSPTPASLMGPGGRWLFPLVALSQGSDEELGPQVLKLGMERVTCDRLSPRQKRHSGSWEARPCLERLTEDSRASIIRRRHRVGTGHPAWPGPSPHRPLSGHASSVLGAPQQKYRDGCCPAPPTPRLPQGAGSARRRRPDLSFSNLEQNPPDDTDFQPRFRNEPKGQCDLQLVRPRRRGLHSARALRPGGGPEAPYRIGTGSTGCNPPPSPRTCPRRFRCR